MAKELYVKNQNDKLFLMGTEIEPVAHVMAKKGNLKKIVEALGK